MGVGPTIVSIRFWRCLSSCIETSGVRAADQTHWTLWNLVIVLLLLMLLILKLLLLLLRLLLGATFLESLDYIFCFFEEARVKGTTRLDALVQAVLSRAIRG